MSLSPVVADVSSGLASWWAPALAFVAGVVSCASPCVWPLLPGYVSFISRRGRRRGGGRRTRPASLLPILLFIAGFTVVFVLLGAFASTFVQIFKGDDGPADRRGDRDRPGRADDRYALQRGSISLYAERRPFLQKVQPGVVGAFPLGMAFAAGWTPCIGPVLGGILAIAASGGTARGVFLLVSTRSAWGCRSCWWGSACSGSSARSGG